MHFFKSKFSNGFLFELKHRKLIVFVLKYDVIWYLATVMITSFNTYTSFGPIHFVLRILFLYKITVIFRHKLQLYLGICLNSIPSEFCCLVFALISGSISKPIPFWKLTRRIYVLAFPSL